MTYINDHLDGIPCLIVKFIRYFYSFQAMESGRRLINDLMAEQIAVSIVHRITCSSLGYFIQSSP